MRLSKTKNVNLTTHNACKIGIPLIFLTAVLFVAIHLHAQSKGEIGAVKVSKEVVRESPQGFKMVADVLDAVGGKSESPSYKMQISAGGQPSPIGESQSAAYKVLAGYVHAVFVLHGDANGDGKINASDVVGLINYLFISGPEPIPMEAGDTNCDGLINASDVVYLINYLFIAGPPPCS